MYKIWLKDGQSFVIKADDCYDCGGNIIFEKKIDGKAEDIAQFCVNNIAGWAKMEVVE